MKKNLIYFSFAICAFLLGSCGNNTAKDEKNSDDSILSETSAHDDNEMLSEDLSGTTVNENQNMTEEGGYKEGQAEDSQTKGYQPPFEFTAEYVATAFMVDDTNNTGKDMPVEKTTIKCKMLPGGKISGTYKRVQISYPRKNYYDWTPDEYVASDRELSGKWSSSWRTMGDNTEKCYGIDVSFLKQTMYLPASGDYLYKSWFDCEDNNTYNSYKILSINQL